MAKTKQAGGATPLPYPPTPPRFQWTKRYFHAIYLNPTRLDLFYAYPDWPMFFQIDFLEGIGYESMETARNAYFKALEEHDNTVALSSHAWLRSISTFLHCPFDAANEWLVWSWVMTLHEVCCQDFDLWTSEAEHGQS